MGDGDADGDGDGGVRGASVMQCKGWRRSPEQA